MDNNKIVANIFFILGLNNVNLVLVFVDNKTNKSKNNKDSKTDENNTELVDRGKG